tara:strand:- start:587 stop:913 length:327 start_codon:yes stop_codon:yes gene_type:complete
VRRKLTAGSNVSISYNEAEGVYRADYYFNVLTGYIFKRVENIGRVPSQRDALGELSKSVAGALTDYQGSLIIFFYENIDEGIRTKFVNVVRGLNLPLELEVKIHRKIN